MAIVCPVDLDTSRLRHEIQSIYARVATDPSSDFHFTGVPRMPPRDSGTTRARSAHSPRWRRTPSRAWQTRFGSPHSQQVRPSSTSGAAQAWT